MDGKKNFQVFHTDTDSILQMNGLNPDDFEKASGEEKVSMTRGAVSGATRFPWVR